jgi:hypothetical protein
MLESQFHKAWTNQGVKALKAEAPRRLKREGWDSVRRALSTTIRYGLFYFGCCYTIVIFLCLELGSWVVISMLPVVNLQLAWSIPLA